MNPFLTEYDTPYQIPPFEKIEDKHYLPAFMKGMEKQIEEVNEKLVDIEKNIKKQ